MVAGTVQENLRFVFKASKRARMNDPRAVALEFGPISVTRLGIFAAARFARFLRERSKRRALSPFHLFTRLPTVLHAGIICLRTIWATLLSGSRATVAPPAALPGGAPAYRKAQAAAP